MKKRNKTDKDDTDDNHDKVKAKENNKNLPAENGNKKVINHYKVLQINGSHACFNTKIQELRTTINENQSQIVVLSEANVDKNDEKKMKEREDKFTDFNFEDKMVKNHDKARICIMIHKNINYNRLPQYEDDENSSITIKIKDGKGRWIGVYGIYHQWKIPGEGNAFNKEGIARQVGRLKKQIVSLNKFTTDMKNT